MRNTTKEERFWAKVDKRGPDECWEWTAGRYGRGYGQFNSEAAHRYAYELLVGSIPDGLLVCHRCDNPPCVNPAHLFLGTHADNAKDAVAKGRTKRGPRGARGPRKYHVNKRAPMSECASWVSISVAAEAAGIPGRTVRRWADTGRIRSTRPEGGILEGFTKVAMEDVTAIVVKPSTAPATAQVLF